jgi:predicted HicB family RNase H-like nuclease
MHFVLLVLLIHVGKVQIHVDRSKLADHPRDLQSLAAGYAHTSFYFGRKDLQHENHEQNSMQKCVSLKRQCKSTPCTTLGCRPSRIYSGIFFSIHAPRFHVVQSTLRKYPSLNTWIHVPLRHRARVLTTNGHHHVDTLDSCL